MKALRLIGARQDLEQCFDAFRILSTTKDKTIYEHVFASYVLAYNRPFTENRGLGSLYCDYPEYKDHPDKEIKIRHMRFLDLRNEFIAHSCIQGMKLFIVPLGVASPLSGRKLPKTDFVVGKRSFGDPRFLAWLTEACTFLRSKLDSDIDHLLDQHYSKFGLAIPIETGADNFKWKV